MLCSLTLCKNRLRFLILKVLLEWNEFHKNKSKRATKRMGEKWEENKKHLGIARENESRTSGMSIKFQCVKITHKKENHQNRKGQYSPEMKNNIRN